MSNPAAAPLAWFTPQLIDIVLLAVLALSVLVGLLRGVTLELMSLAGWFAAWFGGSWLEPLVAPWLPVGEPGSGLNRGVAFACSFLLVLLVWSLLAKLVSMMVKATPLQLVDRLLGGVFGLARGVLVLLVAATLIAWTPAGGTAAWHGSVGGQWLSAAVEVVSSWWPDRIGPPARRPSGGRSVRTLTKAAPSAAREQDRTPQRS